MTCLENRKRASARLCSKGKNVPARLDWQACGESFKLDAEAADCERILTWFGLYGGQSAETDARDTGTSRNKLDYWRNTILFIPGPRKQCHVMTYLIPWQLRGPLEKATKNWFKLVASGITQRSGMKSLAHTKTSSDKCTKSELWLTLVWETSECDALRAP